MNFSPATARVKPLKTEDDAKFEYEYSSHLCGIIFGTEWALVIFVLLVVA
jgi:hypothetical protein